jgi:hypothetical protein
MTTLAQDLITAIAGGHVTIPDAFARRLIDALKDPALETVRDEIVKVDEELLNLTNEESGNAMRIDEYGYTKGCHAGRSYAYHQTGAMFVRLRQAACLTEKPVPDEVDAMSEIHDLLEQFDSTQRRRMLSWILGRLGDTSS